MAKVWAVKECARPHNQDGQALAMSLSEIVKRYPGVTPEWTGANPPSFPDPPGGLPRWPKYVFVEVNASEVSPPLFPRPGFYLLPGVRPE